MLCKDCLEKAVNKLFSEDIIILEYLLKENANISQCSISRNIIKSKNSLSDYKCYTALDRLELFDFIGQVGKSKSNKYFITENGKVALSLVEQKMGDVI